MTTKQTQVHWDELVNLALRECKPKTTCPGVIGPTIQECSPAWRLCRGGVRHSARETR
jgi:hypothetical protein